MAKKGKIKFINEPVEVKGFKNLRQSIKVKVGEELIPVYGDEGDFDQYGSGADVWIRKNGKNWEICNEGDEDIAEKPSTPKPMRSHKQWLRYRAKHWHNFVVAPTMPKHLFRMCLGNGWSSTDKKWEMIINLSFSLN